MFGVPLGMHASYFENLSSTRSTVLKFLHKATVYMSSLIVLILVDMTSQCENASVAYAH